MLFVMWFTNTCDCITNIQHLAFSSLLHICATMLPCCRLGVRSRDTWEVIDPTCFRRIVLLNRTTTSHHTGDGRQLCLACGSPRRWESRIWHTKHRHHFLHKKSDSLLIRNRDTCGHLERKSMFVPSLCSRQVHNVNSNNLECMLNRNRVERRAVQPSR